MFRRNEVEDPRSEVLAAVVSAGVGKTPANGLTRLFQGRRMDELP